MRTPVLSLLFFPLALSAQQADWLESWPMDFVQNPSYGNHVLAQGSGGDLYCMREASGAFIYGQDLFGTIAVDRLDPASGAVLWTCGLLDSVVVDAAAVADDGTVYVGGRFMGSLLTCAGTVMANTEQSLWHVDLFLMAFSAEGVLLWSRNVTQEHPEAGRIAALAVDPVGNMWYAMGEFGVGDIIRTNSGGGDVETRVIDGSILIGSMDFDPWGGLYVSGATDNEGFAFGGQNYPPEGTDSYQIYVLRYDAAGNASFAQFARDVTFQGPDVIADAAGNAYLAGSLMDTSSWDGIHFNGPDWVYSTFLAKLDSTGHFLWGVESDPAGGTIEGDLQRSKGTSIAVDGSSNVYLMGRVRGIVHWSDEVVSGTGVPTEGGLTIAAFGPDGQALWAADGGNGSAFSVYPQSIVADAGGFIHFAAHSTSGFSFAPLETNMGGTQAAVVGEISGATTGITGPRTESAGIQCAPNPVADVAAITWNGSTSVEARLFNSAGKQVRSVRLAPGTNTIATATWAPGLYVLRTADGASVRIMKE